MQKGSSNMSNCTVCTMVCRFLIAMLMLQMAEATIHYVTPDDHYSTDYNTHVFQHYLNNSVKYFASDAQLQFLPGHYKLNEKLIIKNIRNFSLLGDSIGEAINTIITCTLPGGIIVDSSTYVTISKFVIHDCSTNHSSIFDLHYNKDKDFVSLLVFNSTFVTCTYFTSLCKQTICGIKFVNTFGQTNISSMTSHYLIVLWYGTNKYFSNSTHNLYIENFTYHADNKRICALEIQQSNTAYNINIVITKLIASDSKVLLIICNACTGQGEVLISNSSFVGEVDNKSMADYCNYSLHDETNHDDDDDDYNDDSDNDEINVYEVECIIHYRHTGFEGKHVKNIAKIIDSQFMHIFKAHAIVAFFVENNYTKSLSIFIHNCLFHKNKNSAILFAADYRHYLYYNQYFLFVLIKDVTVSQNIIRSPQAFYGNNVKIIFENVIFVSNTECPWLICIFIKVEYSLLQFNKYNKFSENALAFITDSPAIYNGVLNFSLNVLQYPFYFTEFMYNDKVELCFL